MNFDCHFFSGMVGNISRWAISTSTDSLDHQHFLAGFLQNNNNFVWLVSTFLDLDKDLDAALEALFAKLAIRDLDLDLEEVEALKPLGPRPAIRVALEEVLF